MDTANLALAAQSLMMAMMANKKSRVRERDKDESSKSLISNLGPRQQRLLEHLATESMGDPPDMTTIMVKGLKEKSPAKSAHLLMAEMQKWEGCCTEASVHRFLARSFMAKDTSNLWAVWAVWAVSPAHVHQALTAQCNCGAAFMPTRTVEQGSGAMAVMPDMGSAPVCSCISAQRTSDEASERGCSRHVICAGCWTLVACWTKGALAAQSDTHLGVGGWQ